MLAWSGGKDAAYALDHEVDVLLTTYDEATGCLPHTCVAVEVVRRQAGALRLPLVTVPIPAPWDDVVYADRMRSALGGFADGAELAFGDLHLVPTRRAREAALRGTAFRAAFPVWTSDPATRARSIVAAGIRAIIVSVDLTRVGRDWVGKPYDDAFVDALPADADPCGENGEFQTLVTGHPRFERPLAYRVRGVREQGSFACLEVV